MTTYHSPSIVDEILANLLHLVWDRYLPVLEGRQVHFEFAFVFGFREYNSLLLSHLPLIQNDLNLQTNPSQYVYTVIKETYWCQHKHQHGQRKMRGKVMQESDAKCIWVAKPCAVKYSLDHWMFKFSSAVGGVLAIWVRVKPQQEIMIYLAIEACITKQMLDLLPIVLDGARICELGFFKAIMCLDQWMGYITYNSTNTQAVLDDLGNKYRL
jgi:hypothetical protein